MAIFALAGLIVPMSSQNAFADTYCGEGKYIVSTATTPKSKSADKNGNGYACAEEIVKKNGKIQVRYTDCCIAVPPGGL